MARTLSALCRVVVPSLLLGWGSLASAQSSSPPSAQFGDPPPEPAPAAPAGPAPAPPPTAPAAQPAAPAPPPAQPAPPPPYTPSPYAEPGYGQSVYEPPPPPPAPPPSEGFEMPGFAVRVDPLDLLLEGKLGLELEVALWKIITLEVVPLFIVNEEPPTFNLVGREENITRESNGLGALAGASFGAGFWVQGKPFQGYVLRAILTNHALTYRVSDDRGEVDQASHTERHFYGFFGSYSRWGAFTLGGGFGLGVELNKEERCYRLNQTGMPALSTDCKGEFSVKADRSATQVIALNSMLHPVQFMFRFSLGFVID